MAKPLIEQEPAGETACVDLRDPAAFVIESAKIALTASDWFETARMLEADLEFAGPRARSRKIVAFGDRFGLKASNIRRALRAFRFVSELEKYDMPLARRLQKQSYQLAELIERLHRSEPQRARELAWEAIAGHHTIYSLGRLIASRSFADALEDSSFMRRRLDVFDERARAKVVSLFRAELEFFASPWGLGFFEGVDLFFREKGSSKTYALICCQPRTNAVQESVDCDRAIGNILKCERLQIDVVLVIPNTVDTKVYEAQLTLFGIERSRVTLIALDNTVTRENYLDDDE